MNTILPKRLIDSLELKLIWRRRVPSFSELKRKLKVFIQNTSRAVIVQKFRETTEILLN